MTKSAMGFCSPFYYIFMENFNNRLQLIIFKDFVISSKFSSYIKKYIFEFLMQSALINHFNGFVCQNCRIAGPIVFKMNRIAHDMQNNKSPVLK